MPPAQLPLSVLDYGHALAWRFGRAAIDASLEPGSFTKFGDETLAYLLKADISTLFAGYDVNGKILIIRDGPLSGVLIYAILGDLDPRDEESLADLLAGKLAKAEESLPD